MKTLELKRMYEADAGKTCAFLKESLASGELKPEDFSIRDLAENLIEDGREYVRLLNPRNGDTSIREAATVNTGAFSNIVGQIVFSKILDEYQMETQLFSSLVSTVSTNLNGEKIPGMSQIGDQAEAVGEGVAFPTAGFGEDYIETPQTVKRGMIVPVTKEAIFFDRTNLILSRASEVGKWLGVNKEKRIADVVLGVTNNYKWKGTAYDTYQATTPWINLQTSNELQDWTDIDTLELLFAAMVDPHTGEPITITARTLLVMPDKAHLARMILNATEVVKADMQVNATTYRTLASNPIMGYTPVVSALAKARLVAASVSASDAAKYMFFGDFKRAFAYMENWPITVVQAPQNSEAEFVQDIVVRYKASERGVAAVMNPRYVIKSTG